MMKEELSPSTQRKLEAYSTAVQAGAVEVIEEAVSDWLDTVATARLEALVASQPLDNVVCISQFN